MKLKDLINTASLQHDLDAGFIRTNRHPTLPLTLYNYTEKAQFSKHWNIATLNCRGLIVHDDGRIVARPFPKFFNWDEPKPKGSRFQMSLDEPVFVTDKIDGSLGILYPTTNGRGYRIATRGSFTSDQAIHASLLWQDRYAEDFGDRINPDITYLFEIVYPENRIVVDYKGMDDLVLLGGVDIRSGHVYGPEMFTSWFGPKAKTFEYGTLREAVSAKPRANSEGFVVRSISDGLMVKVKQEDYVSLHRVVTGLNEKEIWRRCLAFYAANGPDVLNDVPDELHEWVNKVRAELYGKVWAKREEASRAWSAWYTPPLPLQDEREHRGRFAARIKHEEKWVQKALWIMYDGNDPIEFLWKTVEPKGDVKK